MRKNTRQGGVSRPDGVLSLTHGITHVTYDPEADAAYFSLKKIKKGEAVKTIELQPWLFADLDKKGALLGVEMLFVSNQLPRARARRKAPSIMAVPAIA